MFSYHKKTNERLSIIMSTTLQLLLAEDKQNPYFSIYKSKENPEILEVYFEMALLEKINNGITSYHGKHLLARLYNGNFKRKSLIEVFGIPLSTIRRWGDALLTGDPLIIHNAFSGQGATKKITPEVAEYIRDRFNEIYEYEKYRYSSIILLGIEKIFGIKLTSEAIRPIINDEKKKFNNSNSPSEASIKSDIKESPNSILNTNNCCEDLQNINELTNSEEHRIDDDINPPSEDVKEPKNSTSGAKACDCTPLSDTKVENNRKLSLSYYENKDIRVHHIGTMLSLYLINQLEFKEKITYQWLVSILAGAVNIEQTASLDFKSLSYLIGQECITSKKHQQTILKKIATEANINEIFKQNARVLDLKNNGVFYFDPHSISYTGMQNILKGWCGSAGKICKVYYQDFFHDESGNPIYFKIFDNYFDMRERFKDALIDNFREYILGDKEANPTFIVDRGIYGKEKMIAISKKKVGLVTWEKGYSKDAWDSNLPITHFIIQRPKNNSKDIHTWSVKFIKDEQWDKIDGFHRLIVKIKPPQKGNVKPVESEVSILSNGYISDLDAVKAMLNRWVQENDFKYMIEHFGLNEITSYKYFNYSDSENILREEFNEDIQKLLIEKEVYSDEYKQHSKLLAKLNSQAKALLLKKEKSKGSKKKFDPEDEKELNNLLVTIENVEKERKSSSKKISKLTAFINKDCKFLSYDKKKYMDAIKILARNIFYKLIRIFRPIYDNFREDHKLLRELTQASGVIRIKDDIITCIIDTPRNYNKKQKKSIDIFLNLLTELLNNSNKNSDYSSIKLQIL